MLLCLFWCGDQPLRVTPSHDLRARALPLDWDRGSRQLQILVDFIHAVGFMSARAHHFLNVDLWRFGGLFLHWGQFFCEVTPHTRFNRLEFVSFTARTVG